MFRNFEIKFTTDWHCFLLGFSHEITGMESNHYCAFIGPWCISVTVR